MKKQVQKEGKESDRIMNNVQATNSTQSTITYEKATENEVNDVNSGTVSHL